MSDLGKLVVRLGANIADFSSDMGKAAHVAEKRMKTVGNALRSGFGVAAKAAATVFKSAIAAMVGAGGLGLLIRSSMKATDQIGKMSTRLGVSTAALTELQFATGQTGVKFETFTMGLQRMIRRVAEAAKGTGEAKGALKELRIEATELVKLAPDKQFEVIAESLSGVQNQADKVRLAMKLFDSEGVALLQTMEGGAKAIQAYRLEARALGISLSQDAVRGVEDANDSLDKFKTLMRGLRDQTVAAFAPAIQMAVDKLTAFSKESINAEGGADKLGQALAGKLLASIETVTIGGAKLVNVINRIFNPRQAIRSNELEAELEKVNRQLGILERTRKRMEEGGDVNPVAAANVDNRLEETRKKAQELNDELSRIGDPFDIDKIRAMFEDFNNALGQTREAAEDAAGKNGGGMAQLGQMFTDAEVRAKAYWDEQKRAQELLDSLNPKQSAFNKLIDDLEYHMAVGNISLEEYDRLVEKAKKDLEGSEKSFNIWKSAGEEAGRAVQSAFADFFYNMDGSISDLAKNFVDAMRRMIAQALALRAIRGLFPAGSAAGDFLGIEARASGGPITAGAPYIVGEKGPELIIPGKSGMVVPNDKLGGQNINITINQDNRGAVSLDEMGRVAEAAANKGTMDAIYYMQRGHLPA